MGKEGWTEGKEMGERARLRYLSRGLRVRSYATAWTHCVDLVVDTWGHSASCGVHRPSTCCTRHTAQSS